MEASARLNGGAIEAAIPFSKVSDIRGDRIVCLPFSDYCDPLVPDSESWSQLIARLIGHNLPINLRTLRNSIPSADKRFIIKGNALWHGVDLTRSEQDLWTALDASARQNIRRAQRHNIVVREGRTIDDVRIFYGMHCKLRKSKYRLLAQPLQFFENLHHEFAPRDAINVLIAEQAGCPIAAVFLLEWNGTLYYKFNASLDLLYRPNDLLAWSAILLGRRRGMIRFDFGLSDPAQPGLVRYKQKFATEERAISLLRWQPDDYLNPKGELAGRMLNRITNLMTDPAVPDHVTQAAGDELYRYFC
jgi:CelD/BcsL family acetyltransferase involved in cellulose biosynthesis